MGLNLHPDRLEACSVARGAIDDVRQNSIYIRTLHSTLSPNTATLLTSLGLFGSHELQIIPQLQSCFVKLRLAVTNRATHHLGNFVMLESLDIVEHKNRFVARRQAVNGALQL